MHGFVGFFICYVGCEAVTRVIVQTNRVIIGSLSFYHFLSVCLCLILNVIYPFLIISACWVTNNNNNMLPKSKIILYFPAVCLPAYLSVCLFVCLSVCVFFFYLLVDRIANWKLRTFPNVIENFLLYIYSTSLDVYLRSTKGTLNINNNYNNNKTIYQLTHQPHSDLQWSPLCSYKRIGWRRPHRNHYFDMYG